jgi:integrase/recombinase XerD
MNTQELIDNACSCLKNQKFTVSTIYINFRRFWNGLLKSTDAYTEFSHQMVSDYLTRKYGEDLLLVQQVNLPLKEYRIRHAFHSLIYFYNYRLIPSSSLASSTVRKELLELDSRSLNAYICYVKDQGYSQASLKYNYYTIHNYLVTYPLETISDSRLLDYFNALSNCSKQTVKSKMKILKRFLRYSYEMEFISHDCSSLFPSNKLRSHTEIPSVFTPKEIYQVLQYIRDASGKNSKRNYAIAILIAVYGFRAGDIMKMKLSDVDWENQIITIIQSKTSNLLTHRILDCTGNALADYLLNERPISSYEYIFLKSNGSTIGSSITISAMIFTAFRNAGIHLNGRKHGSHCMRHSLASTMLSNDTSIFEISKVLGHASVDTTRIYAKVDLNHLRLCELEVPLYE